MNNLTKREKLLVLILIIGILGFGYVQLFLKPLMIDISDMRDRISSDKTQLVAIENMKANKNELISQRDNAVGKNIILMRKLPMTLRDPEIVYDLRRNADAIGVKLVSIGIGKPAEPTTSTAPTKSDISVVPVELKVEADSYPNFIAYIDAIEKADRITNVSGVNIATGTVGSATITGTVKVDYFCFNNKTKDAIVYTFDKGVFGKPNLFQN